MSVSTTLQLAMYDKTLRDLRSSPPVLTNALFVAMRVRTFDELAVQLTANAVEMLVALAGRGGRPTLDEVERCAAEGSPEGLDLLCHRMLCGAHKKNGAAS